MLDREKVIKELTEIYDEAYDRWVHCQYTQDKLITLIRDGIPDALALLREQEPEIVRCKDCKHYANGFCYNPSTFDDDKTRGNTTPDWFCADGERR